MTKKRDDLRKRRREEERQRGNKPAQDVGSAEGEASEEAPSKKEVLITLVDEAIEARDVGKTVTEMVRPQMETDEFSNAELTVQTVPNLKALRTSEEISAAIRPQQRVDHGQQQETELKIEVQISSLDPVRLERTTVPLIDEVRPSEQVKLKDNIEVALMEELESHKVNETVSNMVEPSQATEQLTGKNELFEIDEMDPMFHWSGGSPFGSDRPKFVVHVSNGEVPSLQFLQVLLRDTYKELHGGEPGAETVEFVANEPRIPTVQKNIVTLDLTADEWEPSLQNNLPAIEGKGGDIVPKLRQIAGELYTGELGYFVLNIPDKFEHRYRRKEFHSKLVETLADQDVAKEHDHPSSLVEKVKASPVLFATPHTDDKNTFFVRVSQYFSLTPVREGTSVAQVEAVQERVLKKNDWRRVALTERQDDDRESNTHYFWKAAIADGLARKMWAMNKQGYNKFDPFLKQEILSKNLIKTEGKNIENLDSHPDIYINETSPDWVAEGLNEFIDTGGEQDVDFPVIIEFETGRSEGAFNFRKIRDTLDKYSGEAVICLVVPDRILFRGQKRATMIRDLVETWNEANSAHAKLFTPVLDGGICTGLQPESNVINDLYGGQNDE